MLAWFNFFVKVQGHRFRPYSVLEMYGMVTPKPFYASQQILNYNPIFPSYISLISHVNRANADKTLVTRLFLLCSVRE